MIEETYLLLMIFIYGMMMNKKKNDLLNTQIKSFGMIFPNHIYTILKRNLIMNTWCPVCNQGWVEPVMFLETGKIVFVCSESEELWESESDISTGKWSLLNGKGNYRYLAEFMDSLGMDNSDYSKISWIR